MSDAVVQILNLKTPEDRNIYLGETNIIHMQSDHAEDFLKYGQKIEEILSYPDYVRVNKNDDSIEYVKEYKIESDFVKVAVRLSTGERYYARTIYTLNRKRTERFIQNGELKPYRET